MSFGPVPTYVISVDSSYGHRFIGDGNGLDGHGNAMESCLICGALYELSPVELGSNHGYYHTIHGDPPRHCSGDTSHVHGYAGEREDGPNHDCNCLLCDS